MLNIAAILTCHNRKEKTLESLKALFDQEALGLLFKIDVFLVDDGSTDGTATAIKTNFPAVSIIQGSGNLFWNQGMRLAWDTASKTKDYDFYFWLNDDTILDKNALLNLYDTYQEAKLVVEKDLIITAACRAKLNSDTFSYGGSTERGPVYPNGGLQFCRYINGNAVLIPKSVFEELGNLSNDYTHGMGDYDYGLRALKANFNLYTTKTYIAMCPPNEGIPGWCNPNVSLKKRWELLHSPRGLNVKEYIKFRKNFWGIKWVVYAIKAYAKMINPKLYQKIAK
jgi:GT2 family glycosyltransferase